MNTRVRSALQALLALVVVVGLGFAAAESGWLQASRTVTGTPVAAAGAQTPVDLPPAPQTMAVPEPPAQPQFVPRFQPSAMEVITPRGRLNPDVVQISNVAMTAGPGGFNPPNQPAVLTDPATTLPGTDQGTTLIACHSQISPPLVCNFLSELTQTDVNGGSQVILRGEGRELAYRIEMIDFVNKRTFHQDRPNYRDGTPGRLLLMTCDLDLARSSNTLNNRVVVATLVK